MENENPIETPVEEVNTPTEVKVEEADEATAPLAETPA